MIGIGLSIGRRRQGGGGSTPFDPSQLSGLLAWWQDDSIVNNSGTVATWNDKSGNGNALVQVGGAAAQPNYSASDAAYNSRPSCTMTTVKWLATSASMTWGANTLIMVCKPTSVGYVAVHGSDTGAGAEYIYGSTGNSLNTARGGVVSSSNIGASWAVQSVPKTFLFRFDGTHAGHTFRQNGVGQTLSDVSSSNPGTSTTAGQFGLFCKPDGTVLTAGSIAFACIYNRALSDAEAGQVESYVRTRYAHY